MWFDYAMAKKKKSGLKQSYDIPHNVAVVIIVAGFLAWTYILQNLGGVRTELLSWSRPPSF